MKKAYTEPKATLIDFLAMQDLAVIYDEADGKTGNGTAVTPSEGDIEIPYE